jgi:hypothetical protein
LHRMVVHPIGKLNEMRKGNGGTNPRRKLR